MKSVKSWEEGHKVFGSKRRLKLPSSGRCGSLFAFPAVHPAPNSPSALAQRAQTSATCWMSQIWRLT